MATTTIRTISTFLKKLGYQEVWCSRRSGAATIFGQKAHRTVMLDVGPRSGTVFRIGRYDRHGRGSSLDCNLKSFEGIVDVLAKLKQAEADEKFGFIGVYQE